MAMQSLRHTKPTGSLKHDLVFQTHRDLLKKLKLCLHLNFTHYVGRVRLKKSDYYFFSCFFFLILYCQDYPITFQRQPSEETPPLTHCPHPLSTFILLSPKPSVGAHSWATEPEIPLDLADKSYGNCLRVCSCDPAVIQVWFLVCVSFYWSSTQCSSHRSHIHLQWPRRPTYKQKEFWWIKTPFIHSYDVIKVIFLTSIWQLNHRNKIREPAKKGCRILWMISQWITAAEKPRGLPIIIPIQNI